MGGGIAPDPNLFAWLPLGITGRRYRDGQFVSPVAVGLVPG